MAKDAKGLTPGHWVPFRSTTGQPKGPTARHKGPPISEKSENKLGRDPRLKNKLTLNERAHFSRICPVDRRIFKILSALFPEREKVHN